MLKLFLILPCLILKFQPLNAKVEAPNYDFSLDSLSEFFPGKQITSLDQKFGKGEVMSQEQGLITLKYYVAHIRYKFPVIVQAREGFVEDFHARLPNYFLHDIFFQSLINRYGNQNEYKKTGEEAFYVWRKNQLKHIYSAACTITCFPIFYSVQKEGNNESSVMEKMQKANH